ncbi:hypothetical protein [Gordonia soli]|uniref:Uncharacterized protein n=1 Tax=Gordonia soli NBRC 108243 TaxID=1223545 RepID=M0QR43_9ACTN|nr:hypothetical protein [Gordonia soli]GAC70751.1 hypothetical protein GS4_40_00050 [Gordonia soli NBRC 108243]
MIGQLALAITIGLALTPVGWMVGRGIRGVMDGEELPRFMHPFEVVFSVVRDRVAEPIVTTTRRVCDKLP